MRNFSIFSRIGIVLLIAAISMVGLSGYQIWEQKRTIYAEREAKLHHMVAAAIATLKFYDSEAAAGRMSLDQAQTAAKAALRAMRWGEGDYFGVYQYDGVTLVHANPKNEGQNRLDYKDPNGRLLVAELIDAAKKGGSLVGYMVPRPGAADQTPQAKLAYSEGYEPWRWAVQTGVYVDDVDHTILQQSLRAGGLAVALLLGSTVIGLMIARGIVRPLGAMADAMSRLARGDLSVDVPAHAFKDEIGAMTKAVVVFKQNAIDKERAEAHAAELKQRAEQERRDETRRFAEEFEGSVGAVVTKVSTASHSMEKTAQDMTNLSGKLREQASAVAAASEQASANVQTIAAAVEELSGSVLEIGRQVTDSARVAREAVEETATTDTIVRGLAGAVSEIDAVIQLINDIASQTNLLALNATIEAARAGDAGKGFAVVANEVKTLANQTARATDEIAQQIGAVQAETARAVQAIRGVSGTIARIDEISTAIASAVEQQSAATHEIARNVEQAAHGTHEVTANIAGVTLVANETSTAAGIVLDAAQMTSSEAAILNETVGSFVSKMLTA